MATEDTTDLAIESLLDAFKSIFREDAIVSLRKGSINAHETLAVKRIDMAVAASPGRSRPLTLYKGYTNMAELELGGDLTEKAFFVGSLTKPTPADGVTFISLNVPPDVPALKLSDDLYILDRSLKLRLDPIRNGEITAAITSGLTASGSYYQSEQYTEFYNHRHNAKDGRFGSGGAGGGGSPTPDVLKAEAPVQDARREKVRKIMVGVVAAVVVVSAVGLVLVGAKKHNVNAGIRMDEQKLAEIERNESKQQNTVSKKAHETFEGMEEHHKSGITRYGDGFYEHINSGLRGVPVPVHKNRADYGMSTLNVKPQDVERWTKGIDSAFHDHPTPTDGITLFRGTNFDHSKSKVGDIMQDDGFLSTSTHGWHMPYLDKKKSAHPVLMTIKTKSNTPAVEGNVAERELILNRGTPLKITSIKHCSDGICRIEAEVV